MKYFAHLKLVPHRLACRAVDAGLLLDNPN